VSVPQKHFLSGIPRLSCVIRLFMVASMVMERGCDAHEAGVDVLFLGLFGAEHWLIKRGVGVRSKGLPLAVFPLVCLARNRHAG
jgi:hypothetical protein